MSAGSGHVPQCLSAESGHTLYVFHEPSGLSAPPGAPSLPFVGLSAPRPRSPLYPMNHLATEAVPRGQCARPRGFAIAITSHTPFGHERPSLLGSAPVPAVSAGTSCRLEGACLACVSWTTAFAPLPPCVLHFWVGGEVAAMWRFGTDAGVAVRDHAVRAGGGSRGVLMVPL